MSCQLKRTIDFFASTSTFFFYISSETQKYPTNNKPPSPFEKTTAARADGNVTVEVTAKLLERIEHGAQMHATFSLSTAVQARRTFDFCNDLEGADCPRGAGPVKLSLTQWLPRKIPVWLKYNVHVNLRDRHGKSLGCTYLVVQPEGPVDGPAVLAADDL